MYKIIFYEDRKGRSPVRDYTNMLAMRRDKDSRIKFQKIRRDIEFLINRGTRVGEPVVKHLRGEIWELRPLRDRILFAAWIGDSFVLLHTFQEETQLTPPDELADFKERFMQT